MAGLLGMLQALMMECLRGDFSLRRGCQKLRLDAAGDGVAGVRMKREGVETVRLLG